MKRICLVLAVLLVLGPLGAFAASQDSKETLTLKRDLAQERVLRISAELEVLRAKFNEGQIMLQAEKKNLENLNAALKEPEKKTEPEKKK